MNFVNTVIGGRICSLAETALKKFNSQTTAIVVPREIAAETINEYSKKGMNYVDYIDRTNDIVLIFK